MEKSMKIPDIVEMFHQVLAIMHEGKWDDDTIQQCTESAYIKIHDKTVLTVHGYILYACDLAAIIGRTQGILVKCADTHKTNTDIPTVEEYTFQMLTASRHILNLTFPEHLKFLEYFEKSI